jgi:small subunit ribosomal protein S13
MARISGVELQDNWKLDYALTNIKGVGWSLSKKIIKSLSMDPDKRLSELDPNDLSKIASKLEDYPVEGELVRKVKSDIQRVRTIGSYRGIRHARSLPVRGQRTRRNARTKRGKRKTVGAFKKDMLTKMQSQKKKEEK